MTTISKLLLLTTSLSLSTFAGCVSAESDAALPDGVALQPGDVIDALATMGPTQRGKGTLAVELSGAVLTRVVRDGQVVFAY